MFFYQYCNFKHTYVRTHENNLHKLKHLLNEFS